MRKLRSILHLLIVTLLIGGYGAMYAGSIVHDLGHMSEHAALADKHTGCDHTFDTSGDEKHLEVSCFFCSHAPVVSHELSTDPNWTLDLASLEPPTERSSVALSRSQELPSLRGPPTA